MCEHINILFNPLAHIHYKFIRTDWHKRVPILKVQLFYICFSPILSSFLCEYVIYYNKFEKKLYNREEEIGNPFSQQMILMT